MIPNFKTPRHKSKNILRPENKLKLPDTDLKVPKGSVRGRARRRSGRTTSIERRLSSPPDGTYKLPSEDDRFPHRNNGENCEIKHQSYQTI